MTNFKPTVNLLHDLWGGWSALARQSDAAPWMCFRKWEFGVLMTTHIWKYISPVAGYWQEIKLFKSSTSSFFLLLSVGPHLPSHKPSCQWCMVWIYSLLIRLLHFNFYLPGSFRPCLKNRYWILENWCLIWLGKRQVLWNWHFEGASGRLWKSSLCREGPPAPPYMVHPCMPWISGQQWWVICRYSHPHLTPWRGLACLIK